jgi:uncharacterized membrane protein YfcA
MEEIVGYIAAVCIGILLGLIGGGGSILTVPVLVYIFHIEPVLATAYSLFIVGFTSLIGSYRAYRQKLVDFKTAFIFGLPAIVSVYLTRSYVLPHIPAHIATLMDVEITKGTFLMVLFALIMLFASVSMITKKCNFVEGVNVETQTQYKIIPILFEGTVVGLLTGLVGAGGGFLIIPALVLFSKLSMPKAVGTSLLIIALKSLIGFTGDIVNIQIDWMFLGIISALSVVGIVIGFKWSSKISPCRLTHLFGWFVLIMSLVMLYLELSK